MTEEEKESIEAKFKTVEKYYSTKLNGPLRTSGDKISCEVAFKAMDQYYNQALDDALGLVRQQYVNSHLVDESVLNSLIDGLEAIKKGE